MYLQMDPLDNPLGTHPIQPSREFSKEPYPNGWFRFIDNPDCQFGVSSVQTHNRTWRESPEPLRTLMTSVLLAKTANIGKRQMKMSID